VKVDQQRYGSVEVIAPDGPLTDEESAEFVAVIDGQLTSSNPRVVVCMEDVPYVDSHGLELLISFANDLRNRGLPLKLAAVTSTCREILDLTELVGEFEIFDDVEDAVRSFL